MSEGNASYSAQKRGEAEWFKSSGPSPRFSLLVLHEPNGPTYRFSSPTRSADPTTPGRTQQTTHGTWPNPLAPSYGSAFRVPQARSYGGIVRSASISLPNARVEQRGAEFAIALSPGRFCSNAFLGERPVIEIEARPAISL